MKLLFFQMRIVMQCMEDWCCSYIVIPSRGGGSSFYSCCNIPWKQHSPLNNNVCLYCCYYNREGALAETLLSVLELPPFKLCLVDGVKYDVLKGRIQSNPTASLGKLSGTSLFPRILKEICRLNTLSASKTGADTEGTGREESLGHLSHLTHHEKGEQDLVADTQSTPYMGEMGHDFALAYAGGLEFELSLLALSHAVNVRPEKLSGMLWVMQCKGVCCFVSVVVCS